MTQKLRTLEEYVVTVRKKSTLCMVFNTVYNDVNDFGRELSIDELDSYLNEQYTDNKAREEFLTFMKTHFADIELVEVLDTVADAYIGYPYLGSIAINTDEQSEAFIALSKKYGDPYNKPPVNNQCLWIMSYEEACKFHKQRKELLETDFTSFK